MKELIYTLVGREEVKNVIQNLQIKDSNEDDMVKVRLWKDFEPTMLLCNIKKAKKPSSNSQYACNLDLIKSFIRDSKERFLFTVERAEQSMHFEIVSKKTLKGTRLRVGSEDILVPKVEE